MTRKRMVAGEATGGAGDDLRTLVEQKNAENGVVVYSKSYCPFCAQVKDLFASLGVKPLVVELDQLVEERELQSCLEDMTGQRTVPNVFIGGIHVGGCDDTMSLARTGKLEEMLKDAGTSK